MEDRAPDEASRPEGTKRWPWRDLALVVLLLLLSATVHVWILDRTQRNGSIARDGIGFIRYALKLEEMPWTKALPSIEQHPMYPLVILGISVPVRWWMGGLSSEAMALSAQLACAIPATLLVIPMFLLGRQLFDRRVGFWATAIFQCLAIPAKITSDGLSEGVFLFFLLLALWLSARALAQR